MFKPLSYGKVLKTVMEYRIIDTENPFRVQSSLTTPEHQSVFLEEDLIIEYPLENRKAFPATLVHSAEERIKLDAVTGSRLPIIGSTVTSVYGHFIQYFQYSVVIINARKIIPSDYLKFIEQNATHIIHSKYSGKLSKYITKAILESPAPGSSCAHSADRLFQKLVDYERLLRSQITETKPLQHHSKNSKRPKNSKQRTNRAIADLESLGGVLHEILETGTGDGSSASPKILQSPESSEPDSAGNTTTE